ILEPFEQNYPEEHDGTLDSASGSLTCSFNRMGTLLAVGCNDGRLVLWDFITRSIAKIITAHVHPVCSVSWSRNGRQLVSASTDWTVGIWDVLSGECDKQYRFPGPLTKVQFNPRNKNQILACSLKHAPVLIDMKDATHHILPFDSESEQNIVASFDRKGENIYTGNAKGKIMVIEAETRKIIVSFRITTGTSSTSVKSIEFSPTGSVFLVNSSDRVIRVYDSEIVLSAADYEGREPESIQKLQDLVNRTQWKKCCFSGDGNYIVAGSARQHALSIWRTSDGTLVKILNGTKGETILDIAWHPLRAIISSIASGVISIWSHSLVESWSAFAPDFKELDENVEYSEKEDEFDIEDEDKSTKAPSNDGDGEETEVDITTVDDVPFLDSRYKLRVNYRINLSTNDMSNIILFMYKR
ncbi:uncharacterized protein TRIADDRAFT_33540, partial [Trichoplax adhaerens]